MKDNKLIAEFMGAVGTPKYNPTEWDVYITGCLDVDSDDENAQHFYTPDEMKYHKSWDWLMPVVEKIEDIECKETSTDLVGYHLYDIEIRQNVTTIHGTNIEETAGYKLFNTYNAVVEFIKEYNVDSEDDACDMLYGVDNNQ